MSENGNGRSPKEIGNRERGFALGLIFGTASGLVLWMATDVIAFYPVFLAIVLSSEVIVTDGENLSYFWLLICPIVSDVTQV